MEKNYVLNDFKEWKDHVNKYTFNILGKYTDDLSDLDYRYFFKKMYHPYLMSILTILQSDEFKNGKILNSFIIPMENQIILIKYNKNK
jgi:hypothetical protein